MEILGVKSLGDGFFRQRWRQFRQFTQKNAAGGAFRQQRAQGGGRALRLVEQSAAAAEAVAAAVVEGEDAE